MILIIGLGNPGRKFQKTRHNLGFMIVESLKLKFKSFSDWKNNEKLLSKISEGEINGQKVILAKPQTFMNNSGKAVKLLTKTYHLKPNTLIIVHDDIDLPLGKIRISIGRGSAGHKGVQSIIDELKAKNFVRFRVGIRPKNNKQRTKNNIEDFVLQEFNKGEEKILKGVIKKTIEAIEIAIAEGIEKAMSEFNQ